MNLTWDNTTGLDANLRGVQVQYTKWAGYPVYVAPAPAYPTSEADGIGATLVTVQQRQAARTVRHG
ncbi:MAG: hypothetical protein IPI01_19475 [Ignavibacteriae bacterium]|nr:hypothetical protein [Ignavibacteriota bacterium]